VLCVVCLVCLCVCECVLLCSNGEDESKMKENQG
jgi:hypothetical protein